MSNARFRVGMVGVGSVCEAHADIVRTLPEVALIGTCDVERSHPQAYPDLDALVAAGANVIHVLVPPAGRAAMVRDALAKNCRVFVDAPVADGAELERLATARGLAVAVNHALVFEPRVARALVRARSGALGDLVAVDVVRGASYPVYEGGPLPPWYREAGYAFADLGVHALALIGALLGPIDDVAATWRSRGGDPDLPFDDWSATVRCARGGGTLQLSWSATPGPSHVHVRGTRGELRVPLGPRHGLGARFAREVSVRDPGLRELVTAFYRRLASGEPPPVSLEDAAPIARAVAKVVDAANADFAARRAPFARAATVPFLVTGASGNVGKATIARLVADGHRVRAMVRRIPDKPLANVEYCFGNLGDPDAVDRAVTGVETVLHIGAATKGGWVEHRGGTVVGTQNVVDACAKHAVKQLVYLSSMSVIDWIGSSGAAVTEAAALEPRPSERGAYTRAKLEAEQIVGAAARRGLPCVILRPGQIFGPGMPLINGAVARSIGGRWLVLGDGRLELPLVYLDDVIDAIIAAVAKRLVTGDVIQIIDPAHLTQRDVLALAGGARSVIAVPRAIVFALGKLSELPLGVLGRRSPVALYRLKSALARLHYESARAHELLGWTPKIGVREGIRRVG